MASDIVVLFGGASSERKVSVASAQHVSSVLEEAEPWFIAPSGEVHRCDRGALLRHERAFEVEFRPPGPPLYPSMEAALDDPASARRVFFLALHGTGGEDGTVQRLFEERRIAFTGPGATASANAFDKEAAKRLVSAAGIAIAESSRVPRGDEALVAEALIALLARHERIVVKPVASGSSVGLHYVASVAEARRAAAAVAADEQDYLAEEFVAGVELTVGVVDGPNGARALPPSEVRVDPGRAFDYEGKYFGKGTKEITPAEVAPPVARAAQEVALKAHRALGCEGYSRTDVISAPRGPVFLEINTLPGLTRVSFVPQQLAAEGTGMRSFLDTQIALALRRRDRSVRTA